MTLHISVEPIWDHHTWWTCTESYGHLLCQGRAVGGAMSSPLSGTRGWIRSLFFTP